VATVERWSDDRLDDRFRGVDARIGQVAGLPIEVARLTEQLKAVDRELTHEQGAVPVLTRKLEEVIESPGARRERWRAFAHAAIGGFVGLAGGGAILALFNIHTG